MRKFGRRPRGGRAPQVNEGTFEGILAPYGQGVRPQRPAFSVVGYAPENGAGSELWALREKGPSTGEKGPVWSNTLASAPPADKDKHSALFLDAVLDDPFRPSDQFPLESLATAHALRQYAHQRYLSQTGLADDLGYWRIKLVQPGAFPSDLDDVERWQHRHFYSVHQHDERHQNEGMLVAWFWVPHDPADAAKAFGRELWRYYRRNELDGYRELGEVPAGSTERYLSTILRYQVDPVSHDEIKDENVQYYESAVAKCLALAQAQIGSPHPTDTNSELADYRTRTLIAPA